ncbi:MAG: ELM1/GtrOC1 family putative glycosyltransferase, partial [Candidatus Aenigmatarchaeota archaeon]
MIKLLNVIRKILLKLPLKICFLLGQTIGLLFYFFDRKKRRVAFRNIKMAFSQKNYLEIHKILKKSFLNFGVSLIETLISTRLINFVRLIVLDDSIFKDAGIIVPIHEGSWELYNCFMGKKLKYKMFAKAQKNLLGEFLNQLRQDSNLKVCFSLKDAIRSLKENYTLGIVMDHGAEANALEIEFFSHLVPTPKGAVFLARKLNKKLYPCFGYRRNYFFHCIEIKGPIEVANRGDEDILKELNKIYEEYLNKYPYEYLWFYKRFKRKRDLEVLVLTDGKIGHFKQSGSFLSIIKESYPLVNSNFIEVKYKNKISRIILEILTIFSSKNCLGCGRCLKFFLDKETYSKLIKTYADVIVSTGSICAPVNRIFSYTLGAKSVNILKPNVSLGKFELCIIPEHDRVNSPNTVKIKGALFFDTEVDKKIEECKRFFNLTNDKKISFFLGGPLLSYEEFTENLKLFLEELKKFSLDKNYKILISTSRRTPSKLENFL